MGDLSTQKLIPSLFDLFQKGYLPATFRIVGFSRKEVPDEDYRQFARGAIYAKEASADTLQVDEFLSHLSYAQGLFDELNSYERLAKVLEEKEAEFGQCSNKLFYLAVPPHYYRNIFENLAGSGLTLPCSGEMGWTRVLVEKPFGKDQETAQELDLTLGKLFKEEQIFRIDHYLAKEVVQDILMFRFSNLIFEPLWSHTYIERIEISLLGKRGLEGRGAFYDSVGALRDVGQNHALQMLALVAMEDPIELESERIRKERTKILNSLRPITKETVAFSALRGQYRGYTEVPSVEKSSQTETYFKLKVFIDNERWSGVPFLISSGQALDEEKSEIKIFFKKTRSCLCPPGAEHHHQNILTFKIQPNEGISVLFWAKKPGLTLDLEPKELSFYHRDSAFAKELASAYEKVLFDGITGDQVLFASTEEVSAAWNFITPILELWKETPLHIYEKGSSGPEVDLPAN